VTGTPTTPVPPIAVFSVTANSTISDSTSASTIDVVKFAGQLADYKISEKANSISVSDHVSGRDGVDTLLNVERVKFTDITKAFDIDGDAGQGYRLYQAAFNRTPDTSGLTYWVNQMDHGESLHDLAQAFASSQEYQSTFGLTSAFENVIAKFYSNVLGRAPDAAGLAYWVSVGQSGTSIIDLLSTFSESSENKAHVESAVANGINLSSALLT
jgi:serralysin